MMKKISRFSLPFLLVGLAFSSFAAQPAFQRAFVLDVKDGDTVDVRFSDGTREAIRYMAISTAGSEECSGEEAQEANNDLVLQKNVWLEMNPQDGDLQRERNDRILTYVWLDEARTLSVGVTLVEAGYALLDLRDVKDTSVNQDPTHFSVRYADQIIEAQISAAQARRGWWAECDPHENANLIVAAVKFWGNVETVYLVNRGEEPIDLGQGWALQDASESDRNRLIFNRITGPSCILPPGGLLRVHSGGGIPENERKTNTPCDEKVIDLYWTGNRIWNNDGDTAKLFDSDNNLVHQLLYPPFED